MKPFHNRLKESTQLLRSALEGHMRPEPASPTGIHELDALFYIRKGGVMLLNNGRAFSPVRAPDFIGTSLVIDRGRSPLNLQFKLLPGAQVCRVDIDAARLAVAEHDLYRPLAYAITRRLFELCELVSIFSSAETNAYKKIKHAIELYIASQDAVDIDMSLSAFVIEHSGVSRSRVMSILSDLKKSGHLLKEDGRLTIASVLPADF